MDLLGEYTSDASSSDGESNYEAAPYAGTSLSPAKTTPGHVRLIDSSSEEAADLFVRDVPHTRGNWAGHVFCKIPLLLECRASKSVKAFCSRLQQAGWTGSVLSHTSNLHVSLSRPFFLQQSSIESFVNALRQRLSLERSTVLRVTGEKLLVNDSGTRSFWCWSLSSTPSMHRILNQVDDVLREYQQATYYESPEFHVSLASLPGNIADLLDRHAPQEVAETVQTTVEDDALGEDSKDVLSEDSNDDDVEPVIVSIDHVFISFGTTKKIRIDLKP